MFGRKKKKEKPAELAQAPEAVKPVEIEPAKAEPPKAQAGGKTPTVTEYSGKETKK